MESINTALLWPVLAMATLTLAVAFVLFFRRVAAVREGLNPGYFRYNRGVKPPGRLLVAEQHYVNLFEMPLLFYVGCLIGALGVGMQPALLVCAWGYVAARMVHSTAHLRDGDIRLRRNSFLVSTLVLSALWVFIGLGL